MATATLHLPQYRHLIPCRPSHPLRGVLLQVFNWLRLRLQDAQTLSLGPAAFLTISTLHNHTFQDCSFMNEYRGHELNHWHRRYDPACRIPATHSITVVATEVLKNRQVHLTRKRHILRGSLPKVAPWTFLIILECLMVSASSKRIIISYWFLIITT